VTFSFNRADSATSVVWNGYLGPDAGIADIYLDDTLKQTMDCYSLNPQYFAPVYDFRLLAPNETHKLVIQVKGTKNAKSTGNLVVVDGFYCKGAAAPSVAASPSALWLKTALPQNAVLRIAGDECVFAPEISLKKKDIAVYDLYGRLVKKLTTGKAALHLREDAGLSGGVFIVKVKTHNSSETNEK
jgi:hypothetical protein